MKLRITNQHLDFIINEGYNYVPNYDSVQENSDELAGIPFSDVFVMCYLPKGVTNSDKIYEYKKEFFNNITEYNHKTIEDTVDYHAMIFDIPLYEAYELMLKYEQDSAFFGEVVLSDGNVETVCGNLEKDEPYIDWNRIGDDGDYYENFVSPFLDEKECSKSLRERNDYTPIHYKGFEFLIRTI